MYLVFPDGEGYAYKIVVAGLMTNLECFFGRGGGIWYHPAPILKDDSSKVKELYLISIKYSDVRKV